MVHIILYSSKAEDNKQIVAAVREEAAHDGEQEWEFSTFADAKKAADRLRLGEVELISWDVGQKERIRPLAEARSDCADAFLLAVANADTSPLDFLNPTVAPNSLLIRPLTPKETERAADEMICWLRIKQETGMFTLSGRNEQRNVPYSSIYFFEARGKKIYLRLRGEEIGFAGTLEALMKELPPQFARCHRSYIVNTLRVDRVLLAEQLIMLRDGLSVPLSRGYKRAIKELYDGKL